MTKIKNKELKRGDRIWICATYWGRASEYPEDYYEIVLPEALEYRFPEASRPMATLHKNEIYSEGPDFSLRRTHRG